jgi:FMN-dependent NADH-azoreductase
VVYRDLAATFLPHLDMATVSAGVDDALRAELAAELEAADALLIGAPMYNFTIPSTLKAWLDQVIVVGHNAGPDGPVAGTPVTVVASRGDSYAPGTPREDFEFVQNYLEKVLTGMLGTEVDFIVPELTPARSKPEMAELIPLADASRAKALDEAAQKGKALAARLAA